MSDVIPGQAPTSARDLSCGAASVLDRVERGQRLEPTRAGDVITEILPANRTQFLLARWVRDGVIPEPPPSGYATAAAVASATRRLPPAPPGKTSTEVLLQMRQDER